MRMITVIKMIDEVLYRWWLLGWPAPAPAPHILRCIKVANVAHAIHSQRRLSRADMMTEN